MQWYAEYCSAVCCASSAQYYNVWPGLNYLTNKGDRKLPQKRKCKELFDLEQRKGNALGILWPEIARVLGSVLRHIALLRTVSNMGFICCLGTSWFQLFKQGSRMEYDPKLDILTVQSQATPPLALYIACTVLSILQYQEHVLRRH